MPSQVATTVQPVKVEVIEERVVVEVYDDTGKAATVAAEAPAVVEVSVPGLPGRSAYQAAVAGGFVGTETEWLGSLVGDDGLSAYELAVQNGFSGTLSEWLESLQGADGDPGDTSAADASAAAAQASATAAAASAAAAALDADEANARAEQALDLELLVWVRGGG